MALNINGTTGISGVDGSASAPALQGTDSNTGINFASDTVNINTGGTTRATVDSSGRLLLGTTTEGDGLADNLTIADSSNCGLTLRAGSSSLSSIFFADGTGASAYVGQQVYNHSDNSLKWIVNGSERLRITNSGAVRFNTTAAYSNEKFNFFFSSGADNQDCFTINNHNSHENVALTLRHGRGGLSGFSGKMISFLGNDNSEEGSVVIGTSSVSFNTSSDYRLKENQVLISDGITRLKTLKPYRFNFKKDTDTTVDGFFAHEVTAVPEAVSGEKDAMKKIYYEEGDTLPSGKNVGDFKEFSSTEISSQSIDQSKLVPLLTAALQEAIAKIETLETKVAALEAG